MSLINRILIALLIGVSYASLLLGLGVSVFIEVSDLELRIIRNLVAITPWVAVLLTITAIASFEHMGKGERIQVIIALFCCFMAYIAAMNVALASYEVTHHI